MPNAKLQDQALRAAEEAITALGRGDPDGARMAVGIALDRDQIGLFGRLADAVYLVATRQEDDGEVDPASWDQLADAVADDRLRGLVEAARGQ